MPEPSTFDPDWFSPPGQAVAEKLKRSGKPFEDFIWEMDLTEGQGARLLDGRLELDEKLAQRLEKTLGVSASFWISREAHYRKDLSKIAEITPREVAKGWLRELPLKDMAEFGWIDRKGSQEEKLAECLRYFDVSSVETYRRRVEQIVGDVKLRTSQTLRSNPASLATWIRRGEIEAEQADCAAWSRDALLGALPEIRRLTLLREPQKFLPALKSMCAAVGVALVVARAPSGCRASGATKFISERKALLMLSFRHLSDDHFWFSFFHECGHLVLHGKDHVFVEGEESISAQHENEANLFSEKVLLPDPWHRLLDKLPANRKEILRFAARAGISPGIVVGQLQHRGKLGHNYLNYLKRRFTWQ